MLWDGTLWELCFGCTSKCLVPVRICCPIFVFFNFTCETNMGTWGDFLITIAALILLPLNLENYSLKAYYVTILNFDQFSVWIGLKVFSKKCQPSILICSISYFTEAEYCFAGRKDERLLIVREDWSSMPLKYAIFCRSLVEDLERFHIKYPARQTYLKHLVKVPIHGSWATRIYISNNVLSGAAEWWVIFFSLNHLQVKSLDSFHSYWSNFTRNKPFKISKWCCSLYSSKNIPFFLVFLFD